MRIFIIGPGGVGKSTVGKILAEKLDYGLIDLDTEFMNQVGDIGIFINSHGYRKYCSKNSELFYLLLNSSKEKTIFVLSSGFLVHENFSTLTSKHAKTLTETGISILLLPSKNIKETIEVVTKRQISRGIGLDKIIESKKIKERFTKYLKYGDIQIFSHDKAEIIAQEMLNSLTSRLF